MNIDILLTRNMSQFSLYFFPLNFCSISTFFHIKCVPQEVVRRAVNYVHDTQLLTY
jgi:hypothetical protein